MAVPETLGGKHLYTSLTQHPTQQNYHQHPIRSAVVLSRQALTPSTDRGAMTFWTNPFQCLTTLLSFTGTTQTATCGHCPSFFSLLLLWKAWLFHPYLPFK